MGRKKINTHNFSNNNVFADIPKGQMTEGSFSMYDTYDNMSFLPNLTPQKIYLEIERLSIYDDTVSKIKTDFVNTTLSGLDIKCEDIEIKEKIVDFLENRINKNNGGINGLIRRWAGQAFLYDCICGEIVINEDLTDIEDVVIFDPKTVVFRLRKNKHILCQQQYKTGKIKELPFTCFYYTTYTENDNPYAIPRLASCIPAIKFKNCIEKGIKNQVDHWGFNTVVGKLDLTRFKKNSLDETEEEYNKRIKNALNGFQDILMNKKASQPILTTSNFDTTVLDGVDNADDITAINSMIYSKIANSLKVDKMMLNQGDFNTDVYNTVPYKNFLKQVEQAQSVIKTAINKAVNIYMALHGLEADITIDFVKNEVNDEFKAAQAEQMKTRATVLKWQNGFIDSNQAARECGYDKAAIELKPWELEQDNRALNGMGGGDNGNG